MQGDLLYGNPWDRMIALLALRQERLRSAIAQYEGSGPGKLRKRVWDRRRRKDGAYRARELAREAARKKAKRQYTRGPYRLRNSVTEVKVTV